MVDHHTALSKLREGERARVTEIKAFGSIRRRLLDLGLIEGTFVECINKGPHGDPAAYSIRGAVIALRSEDSERVEISLL